MGHHVKGTLRHLVPPARLCHRSALSRTSPLNFGQVPPYYDWAKFGQSLGLRVRRRSDQRQTGRCRLRQAFRRLRARLATIWGERH